MPKKNIDKILARLAAFDAWMAEFPNKRMTFIERYQMFCDTFGFANLDTLPGWIYRREDEEEDSD